MQRFIVALLALFLLGGQRTVVIGIDLPLAGRDGAMGIMAEHGAQLAIDDANQRGTRFHYLADVRDTALGGIQNPHVDKGVDNIYDAPHGIASLQAWGANPKVAGVVGPLRDNIARAELPYARSLGLALVSGTADVADRAPVHLFKTGPPDRALGVRAAHLVWRLGFRRVRVIDGGPPHGAAARAFAHEFRDIGGSVQAAPSDAVFLAGPSLLGALVFESRLAPIVLSSAALGAMSREEFYGPEVLRQAGVRDARYYEIVADDGPARALRARFVARFAEAPSAQAIRTYVAASVLITAAEETPNAGRSEVLRRLQLARPLVVPSIGQVRFDPASGDLSAYAFNLLELRNGRLVGR